jgi:putative ABC transport system permease protein
MSAGSDAARLEKLREISSVVMKVPGVRAVGYANDVLLPGYSFAETEVVGPGGKTVKASIRSLGKGFEHAAGLALRRGQWLSHTQGDHVLINESLARAFWPNENPVGQFLRVTTPDAKASKESKGWYVEGVLPDIRGSIREPAVCCVYGPETWAPGNESTFVVRLARPYDDALAGLIRRELYAYDPQMVVTLLQSIAAYRDTLLWGERMADSVLKVLSGIAGLLTVVGMFSVLAYTVDCRMGEFGVRMALGATRNDVVNLVVRRGLMLAALGLVIGIAGALALTRYLESLLYETSPQDPWMLAGVVGILVATAIMASALPAYQAAKVDVSRLLRRE